MHMTRRYETSMKPGMKPYMLHQCHVHGTSTRIITRFAISTLRRSSPVLAKVARVNEINGACRRANVRMTNKYETGMKPGMKPYTSYPMARARRIHKQYHTLRKLNSSQRLNLSCQSLAALAEQLGFQNSLEPTPRTGWIDEHATNCDRLWLAEM